MRKLLYTTHTDLSIEYFTDWDIDYYDNPCPNPQSADLVYFRDPFNDDSYTPNPEQINRLIKYHQGSKIVDHLTSFPDIVKAEDKYLQSQQYGDLYPNTWLPSQQAFTPGKHLAKPRISQRAKDILFVINDRKLDDNWIIQDLLDIKEELRVYVVNGQIIQPASIKSPKSSGKVKVIGTRPITTAEQTFVQEALSYCPLDIVGFDIAVLGNGDYKVIEANRSPQFRRYTEQTGINIAKLMNDIDLIDK